MELRVLWVEYASSALQVLGLPEGAAETAGQAFVIQQDPSDVAGVAAGVAQPPVWHQPLFCLHIATQALTEIDGDWTQPSRGREFFMSTNCLLLVIRLWHSQTKEPCTRKPCSCRHFCLDGFGNKGKGWTCLLNERCQSC